MTVVGLGYRVIVGNYWSWAKNEAHDVEVLAYNLNLPS